MSSSLIEMGSSTFPPSMTSLMRSLLASLIVLLTAFSAAGQTAGYLEISSPEEDGYLEISSSESAGYFEISSPEDPRPFYDLRINEAWIDGRVLLVNENSSSTPTPSGFIELKNSSTSEINLEGYQLRAVGTPFPAFTFPSAASIAAGGYERVWTNGKNLITAGFANAYHMPFWIVGADSVTLHDPSGNLIDVLDLSNTQPDVSIGRCDWDWCATNDRAVFYFDTPTPLAANAQANILNLVAPNHVSVKAGTTVSVPTVRPQGGKPIFSLEFGTGASIDSNGVVDVPTDILPDRTPVGMPVSRESLADDNLTSSLAGSSVNTKLSTLGWTTGVSSANLIGNPTKSSNAGISKLYNTPNSGSRKRILLGEEPEPDDSCIYFSITLTGTNIRCTTDNFLTSTDLGAGPLPTFPAGKANIFKTPLGWFYINIPSDRFAGTSVYRAPLADTSPWVSQDWVRQDIDGQSGSLARTTYSLATHSFDWHYDVSSGELYILLFDYSSNRADGNILTWASGAVNIATDVITTTTPHGYSTTNGGVHGPVRLTNTTGTGLPTGEYYLKALTTTTFSLRLNPDDVAPVDLPVQFAASLKPVGNSIYRAVYTAETGVGDFVVAKTFGIQADDDPADGIRHGHVIQFDAFTGHAWAGTGDAFSDCKLLVSYDFGLTWTIFAMGLQDYRPLSIWFTANAVWWNNDNTTDMDIFRLDRSLMVGGEWPVHAVELEDSGTLRNGVYYVIDQIFSEGTGTIADIDNCSPSCGVDRRARVVERWTGTGPLPTKEVTLGAGDKVFVVLDPNDPPWTKYGLDNSSHWFSMQVQDPLGAGGFMTIMAIEAGNKEAIPSLFRDGRLRLVGIYESADGSVIDIQELFSWPRRGDVTATNKFQQLEPRHISPSGVMLWQGRDLSNYTQGQVPNVYDPTRNYFLMELDWNLSSPEGNAPPSADYLGGPQSSPGESFPSGQ